MQLASHGARAAARNISNVPHMAGNTSRSIHIPSYLRPQPRVPGSFTQKLLSQTRIALTRFFTHLTAPGIGVQPSFTRSLHQAGRTSIQQGLSFPVRTALSRPLQAQFLPRAPPSIPRTITQVGLGTARNFSSGRPIFQNLAENIPVAGRAFYEADWDVKMHKEREMMRNAAKKQRTSTRKGGKEMLKPKAHQRTSVEVATPVVDDNLTNEIEMNHFFAAPINGHVTTNLLIPLAPTPTSRVPLPAHPSAPLLPLHELAYIHNSHETRSLRVSSLFSRLDAANVWEKGVVCYAYAHRADAEGVCTILKVEFVGWTKAEVRSVIGEAGSGWCVLEEVNSFQEDEEDSLSDTSSVFSGISGEGPAPLSRSHSGNVVGIMDPAQSFVLPTLDFSSSFLGSSSSPALSRTPSSDLLNLEVSELDFDNFSDSAESDFSGTGSFIEPPSTNGWFGFSSDFAMRAGSVHPDHASREPRESLFY